MSRSESLAHVTGNRIRIQRIQDTRLLSGWVESASKGLVYLSVNQPGVLQVGDELCCECYSFKRRILLQGTIDRTLGSFENQRFLVKLANEPVVYEGSESPRFRSPGLAIEASHPDGILPGVLVDVSTSGMGLAFDIPIARGQLMDVSLRLPKGIVEAGIEVRWSHMEPGVHGYRTGALIKSMTRDAAEDWVRFMLSVPNLLKSKY